MKTSDEMVSSLLKRRDEYVARQKQKRKTVMKIASVTCAFALVALVGLGVTQSGWLESPAPAEKDGPGIGGDDSTFFCEVHSHEYHAVSNFRGEPIRAYHEYLGENYNPEDKTIVGFVEYTGVTREEFMETWAWTEENIDKIAREHGEGCPYTRRQFLDAVYGDDPALSAWVFSSDYNWPKYTGEGDWFELVEEGSLDWPPEGYGFGETPNN